MLADHGARVVVDAPAVLSVAVFHDLKSRKVRSVGLVWPHLPQCDEFESCEPQRPVLMSCERAAPGCPCRRPARLGEPRDEIEGCLGDLAPAVVDRGGMASV